MPDKPSSKHPENRINEPELEGGKISNMDILNKEYEIQYRALFDSANDTIILMDRDLVIDCNKRSEELFRCSREEIVGQMPAKFWPEKQRNGQPTAEYGLERIKEALHGERRPYELVHKRMDGTLVDTDVTLNLFEIKGKKYLQAIIRDISERKATQEALRQSEERYRTILEDILEGCYECDLHGNYTFFNTSFCKILGYSPEEISGSSYKNYMDEENTEKINRIFKNVFTSGTSNSCVDCVVITKEGLKKNVEISVSLIKTADGESIGFRGVMRDITERKKNEEIIAFMAFHDPLTGLPNRRLFDDRISFALEYVKRNNKKMAIMLMDLDKFKEINDTLGHQMGDKLLKEVSIRINELVRKSDTLARMGGDEFMVLLLPEINKLEDIIMVANRIIRCFGDSYTCDNMKLFITASMGISIYPDHGEDVETLISRADIAMYQAKNDGGNKYKIYHA
jgi:diguanylate cyclase (GGDEF)-like protein/PAS domain S-box-containing protein